MLTDLPLKRLLEGAAESLREEVAPHVEDPFGRMQVRAIDELLRNLAVRATWNVDEIEAETAEAAALLQRVEAAGWTGAGAPAPDPADSSVDRALAARNAQLARLGQAIEWVQGAGRDNEARLEIEEYLTRTAKRERALLQSGMYG